MKRISFLSLIMELILNFSLFSAPAIESPDKQSKFVNFNVIFTAKDTAIGDTAIQSMSTWFQDSPVWLKKNYFREIFDYSCLFGNSLISNKKRAFVVALCGLYAVTQYRLLHLTKQLINSNCWSLWRHEKSLENLFAIPQNQLARELLTDVQRHYTTIDNPTDFIRPLTLFLDDVEKEFKQLTEYKNLCRWMERIYILRFSIVKTNLLEEIDDRLKRLTYIKNTFLTWVAEYKLEKRKRAA